MNIKREHSPWRYKGGDKESTEETGAISERLKRELGKKWGITEVLFCGCVLTQGRSHGDRSMTMMTGSVKHAHGMMNLGEGRG